jgi:GrpB-like predicted nucleotidyltransferase (UPF0157 family)/ADP-ribose pyrophosphatase YjhB (NUDIX family)
MRKVEVVPYDKEWTEIYIAESEKIKEVFGGELLNIYHFGSTSVPGMVAKPIIDILVEVQDINKVDSFNSYIIKQGYAPRGENDIEGRRYFIKGNDIKRTHHLHIYQTGAKEIAKHLAFRDYLIENQNESERYKELKKDLSYNYPDNVKLYQEKKSSLVNELTEKALFWANENKKTSVMGFILREKEKGQFELLSLSFKSIPNAHWRVPGGGVEDNENLLAALHREIWEETGLSNLTLIRKIGVLNYYKPYIKRNVERHDFLLLAPSDTLDSWEHKVRGEDKDAGMYFEYKWIKSSNFLEIDGELRSFLTPKHIPELFN